LIDWSVPGGGDQDYNNQGGYGGGNQKPNAGNRFGMQNNSRAKPFSGSVDGLIR
jgi:hypothetical protein